MASYAWEQLYLLRGEVHLSQGPVRGRIHKPSSPCSPLLLFNIYFSVNAATSISSLFLYLTKCFFYLCQACRPRQSFTSHHCRKVIVPLSANHSNTRFITTIALQREIGLERAGWHWYPSNPFKMHKGLQGKANCQPTLQRGKGLTSQTRFLSLNSGFLSPPVLSGTSLSSTV